MYSHEDRMKVVMLYIKYDLSAADAIRELGYPGRKTLLRWYREYKATGELHRTRRGGYKRAPKYTPEQAQAAVDYYLDHGRNISRTVRALGYPARITLKKKLLGNCSSRFIRYRDPFSFLHTCMYPSRMHGYCKGLTQMRSATAIRPSQGRRMQQR